MLAELYADPDKVVVTAHRGFSGRWPENTLIAYQQAIRVGADIVEMDVKPTRDGVPVLLHDPTLDRTSNGAGPLADHSFDDVRRLNFSFWSGGHNCGRRLTSPAIDDVTIPTFEEVVAEVKGHVGLNIHTRIAGDDFLRRICRIYQQYDLYDDGYFTVPTFEDAQLIRDIDPRIEVCVLQFAKCMDLDALRQHKAFGSKYIQYIQPRRQSVTPEFCRHVKELGLNANMFYSNTDEDSRRYIGYGLRRIMTDYPGVLIQALPRIPR